MPSGANTSDSMPPRLGILAARGLFYIVALVIVGAIAWCALTRINMVVRAEGKLTPRSEPLRLSVPQGGIIEKVIVAVGSTVRPGQPLLEIDSFREAADTATDRHQLEEAKAEFERFKESAAMLDSATASLKLELANEQQASKLIWAETAEMQEGYRGGAVSLFEVQAKKRDLVESDARIAQLESDLTRSEAETRQDLRMETEAAHRIDELEIKLGRDVEVKQKTVLSAPTGGVVATISSFRAGRYLAPNEVAATIIPADEPLMAEIWIPNASMRRVRVSLPVRMKLQAYPYQQYGLLPGTLVSVDPDANETTGAYRAWVRPDQLTFDGAQGRDLLRPGLSLTAEIIVDKRTVLDVVLDPIRRFRHGFSISD
jgi:hemolysin D